MILYIHELANGFVRSLIMCIVVRTSKPFRGILHNCMGWCSALMLLSVAELQTQYSNDLTNPLLPDVEFQ